jgi:hypothetical protein
MHLRYSVPSGDARSPVAIGMLERWRFPHAAPLIRLCVVGNMQLGEDWLGDQTADVAAVPDDLLDQVELGNEYSGLAA